MLENLSVRIKILLLTVMMLFIIVYPALHKRGGSQFEAV